MTTRTAITCPAHGQGCVCIFVIEPPRDPNDPRPDPRAVTLPHVYTEWLGRAGGVVVAVEHHPTIESPDAAMTGATVWVPEHRRRKHWWQRKRVKL